MKLRNTYFIYIKERNKEFCCSILQITKRYSSSTDSGVTLTKFFPSTISILIFSTVIISLDIIFDDKSFYKNWKKKQFQELSCDKI